MHDQSNIDIAYDKAKCEENVDYITEKKDTQRSNIRALFNWSILKKIAWPKSLNNSAQNSAPISLQQQQQYPISQHKELNLEDKTNVNLRHGQMDINVGECQTTFDEDTTSSKLHNASNKNLLSIKVSGKHNMKEKCNDSDSYVEVMDERGDFIQPSIDTVSHTSIDYRLPTTQSWIDRAPMKEDKQKLHILRDDSMSRNAIPTLPVFFAVICLLLNIFIPGSGLNHFYDIK